jgi:hypothetical protein
MVSDRLSEKWTAGLLPRWAGHMRPRRQSNSEHILPSLKSTESHLEVALQVFRVLYTHRDSDQSVGYAK